MTFLAFVPRTICQFYVHLVTLNKTVRGFPAIFEILFVSIFDSFIGCSGHVYQRDGSGGGGETL